MPALPADVIGLAFAAAGLDVWCWDLASGQLIFEAGGGHESGAAGARSDPDEFFAQRLRPEDLPAFRAACSNAFTSVTAVSQRAQMADGNGGLREVELRVQVRRDTADRPTHLIVVARDAPGEQTASQLLAEQAEKQRALVERLSVATQAAGIYVWEFDWERIAISWDEDRLTKKPRNRHVGYELGSDLFQYVHPEDTHVGMTTMRAALEAGETDAEFRYRLNLPDGTIRHIQAYARTYTDAAGKPLRSLGVSWDVTREVEAAARLERQAEQLLDAQRRLERASLSIQEGHWEVDQTTRRHWASSTYYALLGYRPDEVCFDTIDKLVEIVHPDDRARGRAALDDHIRDRTPWYDTELRVRVKDGSYRWFRLRGSAERDEEGNVIRIAGSIRDIEREKAAESALREAQARFERAVQGTQDGLWEADLRAERMWLSPRMHSMLGFAEGELSDDLNVLGDRIHPEDRQACEEAWRECLEKHLPMDCETRMRRKDGEYRWFRVRATPDLSPDGTVLRMSGSMQDVTEARAARDALVRATEAAQAASRSKSAFIANVSHEIRTPMNGIIGMTSLLLDTPLNRVQREYAETIRASADALLTVINDILDFSKIEAGKLDIESVEMDLAGAVEDLGATMAFQAAAKGLELIINVHPDVPARVRGDPQRIRQCLINLIGNAIKFTRAGEISVEVAVVGRRGDCALTRFEVRDTGIGIAPDVLKTLFQPFVQADASTTRHFGGTGLGLSIVKRLIELMGGEVGVTSEPGKGSRFWFELPLLPLPAEAPAARPGAVRAGRRILVVDDNETNRHVLATHLARAGYDVTLASSGREALITMRLALGKSRMFDIVLSDLQMPDMDGAMLGEQINADPELSHARVVLLTSVDRHSDLDRFASMGFAGYLSKPVRMRELLACLDKVLLHESYEWHTHTHPMVTASSAQEAGTRSFAGKVLLVEDNPVNQKVGQRFLERLGCEVTVAENGAECLELWEQGDFKLVLMDVQMPVMDGYTATRHIRDREAGRRRRTPIVALTANAMTGQLERCLQSGMDGLLTKPLDPARLRETLERFGLRVEDATLDETAVQTLLGAEPAVAPVDGARFRELISGDMDFARLLVESFASSARELADSMREAHERQDVEALIRAAHQLKGASANIHAPKIATACAALEKEARHATRSWISARLSELAKDIDTAVAALLQLVAEPPAATKARRH